MKMLITRTEWIHAFCWIIIDDNVYYIYLRWLYISSVRQIKLFTSKLMIVWTKKIVTQTSLTVNEFGRNNTPAKKIPSGLVAFLLFFFSLLVWPNSKQSHYWIYFSSPGAAWKISMDIVLVGLYPVLVRILVLVGILTKFHFKWIKSYKRSSLM